MASRWGAFGVLLAVITGVVRAQESVPGGSSLCYGAGSIAMAVIFTFFGTLLLVGALFYYLKRRADAKRDLFGLGGFIGTRPQWKITRTCGFALFPTKTTNNR